MVRDRTRCWQSGCCSEVENKRHTAVTGNISVRLSSIPESTSVLFSTKQALVLIMNTSIMGSMKLDDCYNFFRIYSTVSVLLEPTKGD